MITKRNYLTSCYKLEKTGYRASKKKSKFFMKETKWLGHEINENGIKPNDEKVEAILKLKPPENTKDLKSFLGAIQYMAKFLPKLSEQTDRLRKLLKKNEPWIWTGTRDGLQPNKTNVNQRSMFSAPCERQRQHGDNRCQQNRTRYNIMAKTRRRKYKTDCIRKQIFKRYRKKLLNR